MKKYSLIIFGLLFILTGCGSKTSLSFSLDTFICKFYHNGVTYKEVRPDNNIDGLKIMKEYKEETDLAHTGYIKSLFVIKNPVESGAIIQDIVDVNTQKLKSKLLKYTQLEKKVDTVKCKRKQYPGYISTFSYALGEEKIYDGQYYFINDTTLYMLSLSSTVEKDIKRFVKSVHNITCK